MDTAGLALPTEGDARNSKIVQKRDEAHYIRRIAVIIPDTIPMIRSPPNQGPDDLFTSLFCRALYDFKDPSLENSVLSFRQNDIIEVLTQKSSGWWDGLLGDERGWFPSNYITLILDEEAELALSG